MHDEINIAFSGRPKVPPQGDAVGIDASSPAKVPSPTASPTLASASQTFAPAIPPLLGLAVLALVGGLALESVPAAVATAVVVTTSLLLAAVIRAVMASLSRGDPRHVVRSSHRRIRVGLVGTPAAAAALRSELHSNGLTRFEVVGWIEPHVASPQNGSLPPKDGAMSGPRLGGLAELGDVVQTRAIDLLVVAFGVPRPLVVEKVLHACDGHPVRLCDLSSFYEHVFGHVAVTEIDSAWFAYLLDPRFRSNRRSQRAFDLVVGGALAALSLPLLTLLVLVIRRDGAPALFRQIRVGAGGHTFTLWKLRTMRAGEARPERWSEADDERVTRLGRFLRRTHLDELPQLYNVLRGEMSLVGPRPEQPQIAARLEATVPFWRCRYRHKPGLTGWAQIRCGYGGSEGGSVWKLAHDLYYLRHQSLALDIAILVSTLRALFVRPQYLEPPETAFVARTVGTAGELGSGVSFAPSVFGQ
jgi:lipopolysaccharide/colanic/teichoic acid biosynthesis glycosyltransferase